jgi:hypothetical protein
MGGLTMSTLATLLIVPAIFVFVVGKATRHSISVHPDDTESPYYDPPEDSSETPTAVEAST